MKSVTVWFLDYELAEKSILIYINLPIKVLENKIPEYVAKKKILLLFRLIIRFYL